MAKKMVSFRMSQELNKAMKHYCVTNEIQISEFINDMIRQGIKIPRKKSR